MASFILSVKCCKLRQNDDDNDMIKNTEPTRELEAIFLILNSNNSIFNIKLLFTNQED